MASWFTSEQKVQLDKVFEFYDKDKSGEIQLKDIGEVRHSLGGG